MATSRAPASSAFSKPWRCQQGGRAGHALVHGGAGTGRCASTGHSASAVPRAGLHLHVWRQHRVPHARPLADARQHVCRIRQLRHPAGSTGAQAAGSAAANQPVPTAAPAAGAVAQATLCCTSRTRGRTPSSQAARQPHSPLGGHKRGGLNGGQTRSAQPVNQLHLDLGGHLRRCDEGGRRKQGGEEHYTALTRAAHMLTPQGVASAKLTFSFSFCSPSRGPTSTMVTEAGSVRPRNCCGRQARGIGVRRRRQPNGGAAAVAAEVIS